MEAVVFGRDFDGGFAGFGEDGPGGVLGEAAFVAGADAEDVVAEGGDLEDGGAGGEFDSVGEGFELGRAGGLSGGREANAEKDCG